MESGAHRENLPFWPEQHDLLVTLLEIKGSAAAANKTHEIGKPLVEPHSFISHTRGKPRHREAADFPTSPASLNSCPRPFTRCCPPPRAGCVHEAVGGHAT